MSGQHVGALSDSLGDDDGRSAARAQQEALKRLARPITAPRGPKHDIGDGDVCPIDPTHGKMLTIQGTTKQQCPHQTHDGSWVPGNHAVPTKAVWPLHGFAAAVAAYQGAS